MKKRLQDPKNFIVKLEAPMHKQLKDYAHELNISMSELIRQFINTCLEKNKNEQTATMG